MYEDLDFQVSIKTSDFKIFQGVKRTSWTVALKSWIKQRKEIVARQEAKRMHEEEEKRKREEYEETHRSVNLTEAEQAEARMNNNRLFMEREEREEAGVVRLCSWHALYIYVFHNVFIKDVCCSTQPTAWISICACTAAVCSSCYV